MLILVSLQAQKEGEAFGFSVGGSEVSQLKPYGIYGIVININHRPDSSVEVQMAYAVWTHDTLFQISLFDYHNVEPAKNSFKTWELKEKTGTIKFIRKKEDTDTLWIQISNYVPGVFGNYWIEFQGTLLFIDRKGHEFKPLQPVKIESSPNDY